MSFKVVVKPSGREFTVEENETVLDAALRQGIAFPYGCRGGACGACKGKILSGGVNYGDAEPMALSEEDAADNLSLLCIAKASSDLVVEMKEVGAVEEIPVKTLPVKVARMEKLNEEVMALYLKLPETERLQYLAGQYVEFILEDGRRRAFSIANAPHEDEFLQFHIRHIQGGKFTKHVFENMNEGELLRIEGPLGTFFLREDSERPVIMLATGTGFGPIKAIIEHAIAEQMSRPIYLYWGARNQGDLYMDELAKSWDAQHDNIHYIPVLSRPEAGWEGKTGYVQNVAAADHDDLTDFELYACGHPDMVYSAKEALTAKGLDPEHCYSDAFAWQKD